MDFITKKLSLAVKQALENCGREMGIDLSVWTEEKISFEHPKNERFGDYSTNVSFDLVRSGLIKDLKPVEVAQKLVFLLKADTSLMEPDFVDQIEVAAGGFINFKLTDKFLLDQSIKNVFTLDSAFSSNKQQIVVEYSSPNIAKPFTIGHLRSTIIGDAIANLAEFVGYQVHRDNHLGDWGTQFGKQICAIEHWGDLEKIAASDEPVKELVALYVKFHQEAEKDPSLEDEAREWFVRLENGDTKTIQLWQFCIDISMKEFDRIYKLLGVHFTENDGRGFGESYFEDKMPAVVDELRTKKLMRKSEGAEVVFYPEDKFPPLMILKKDGSTLYSTRDLATDKFRWDRYGSDLTIVNEVGAEQTLYFKQIFALEEMLGWLKNPAQRVHVKHGMYRFGDRKMSTRKGDVVWLEDVLQEAFDRVREIAGERDNDQHIWKIAIGALKWNDLSKESTRDINFDLDEIANLKGNSGPYMQYSLVRAISILQKSWHKAGKPEFELQDDGENLLIDRILSEFRVIIESEEIKADDLIDSEKALYRWLLRFDESVLRAMENYQVHQLANYLYELATRFNTWYAQEEILGNPRREALTWQVASILKKGLNLMGIEAVAKM